MPIGRGAQVHITNSPNRMKGSGTHRKKEEIFFREVQPVLKLRERLTRKRPVRLSFIPFSLNISESLNIARELHGCVSAEGNSKEMPEENEALRCLAREECAESTT